MEEQITITRSDLIAAFQRWHKDVGVNSDGNLKGQTPDNPAGQADILLGYLKQS